MVCVLVPVRLYMHLHDEMIDSQDEQVQWNTNVIFPEKAMKYCSYVQTNLTIHSGNKSFDDITKAVSH